MTGRPDVLITLGFPTGALRWAGELVGARVVDFPDQGEGYDWLELLAHVQRETPGASALGAWLQLARVPEDLGRVALVVWQDAAQLVPPLLAGPGRALDAVLAVHPTLGHPKPWKALLDRTARDGGPLVGFWEIDGTPHAEQLRRAWGPRRAWAPLGTIDGPGATRGFPTAREGELLGGHHWRGSPLDGWVRAGTAHLLAQSGAEGPPLARLAFAQRWGVSALIRGLLAPRWRAGEGVELGPWGVAGRSPRVAPARPAPAPAPARPAPPRPAPARVPAEWVDPALWTPATLAQELDGLVKDVEEAGEIFEQGYAAGERIGRVFNALRGRFRGQ